MRKDKVFFSYSHKDEYILNEILVMLKPYVKNGPELWSDKCIQPGREWRIEIENALNTAKVAVLLVSKDFLASDFIVEEELPPLLEAAQRKETTIAWVLVGSCGFEKTSISRFQPLISPNRPLRSLSGDRRSKAIKGVAEQITLAWEAPAWARKFPVDQESSAALDQFLALAERYSSLTPPALTRCFHRAVEECHGANSLRLHFPQLAAKQELSWAVLTDCFSSSCKPPPDLVSALARHLDSRQMMHEKHEGSSASTFLALVVQWAGASARGKNYYSWKVFVQHAQETCFHPIKLGDWQQAHQLVVFEDAGERETPITFILAKLLAWAGVHTTLPILEIFAPVDLLDAAWSDLVVDVAGEEEITLLKAIPYVLRPADRLEDSFNSNRQRLINKMRILSEGKGKWSAGEKVLDHSYLGYVLVEEDQVVGVKRFHPFPVDDKQRSRWFRALLKSMVPIAIWWRHDSLTLEKDRKSQLRSYMALRGHRDGAPVSPDCVRHDDLACQRKRSLMHPLASQLVLMLDHWERSPKITPQQRGATRAVSPSHE